MRDTRRAQPARARFATRNGKPLAGTWAGYDTEVEMRQEDIAKLLGVSRQAVSLLLDSALARIRKTLQKLVVSGDFDSARADDAESFVLALRAAFAERKASADESRGYSRFFYFVKPLKPLKSPAQYSRKTKKTNVGN